MTRKAARAICTRAFEKLMQSLIAVACKLIRLFYMVLQTGVSYDAAKLTGDIHRPVTV